MKYLKKFENKKIYNIDDYILFYDDDDDRKINNGKIIDVFIRENITWYEVAMIESSQIGFHTSILYKDIFRLMTSKEIEDVEIRNNSKKYNI